MGHNGFSGRMAGLFVARMHRGQERGPGKWGGGGDHGGVVEDFVPVKQPAWQGDACTRSIAANMTCPAHPDGPPALGGRVAGSVSHILQRAVDVGIVALKRSFPQQNRTRQTSRGPRREGEESSGIQGP